MSDPKPNAYSADRVRQGEIILRTRTRRIIFVVGLAGAAILALLVEFMARHAS
jgi:hypothetical protein